MTNLEELSWSCSTLSTDLWGFSPPRWSSLTGDTCSSFWAQDTFTKRESLKQTTYLWPPPTSAPPKTCPEFPSGSDKMLCLSWTGTLCSSSSSWLLPRYKGIAGGKKDDDDLHLLQLALEQTKLELLRAEPSIRVIVVKPFELVATNIIGSEEEFMNVSSLVNRASIPVAASIILPPKNNDHGFLSLQVLSPADPGSRVGLVVIKPKPPVPLPTGPENVLMKSV